MPLIRDLRDKKDEYIKALEDRFSSKANFEKGLEVYKTFRSLKKEIDDMRAVRNKKSKEFAESRDKAIIKEVKRLKADLTTKEAELDKVRSELRKIELTLPNWINEGVPIGEGEEENVAVKYVGTPDVLEKNVDEFKKLFPDVEFNVVSNRLHHADLIEEFELADMESAAEIAGSRFYIEKNELATLDLALSLFAIKEFTSLGFQPVVPPYMMKRGVEERITYFTSFEDSIYSLKEDDLILITTSEHPLAAVYENHTFSPDELPVKLVAFSPAFRREAGSHGKDTKGIFRTHQFNKVELHSIVPPEEDVAELERLMAVVEGVMAKLDVPYRIVANSSGDMDNRALVQYDLEAWFPAQNRFRELHSFATVGTWISEKLKTKVRRGGSTECLANVYATGIAIQRTLLAIMVNNYDPEAGEIHLPEVLKELSGIRKISR